MRAAGTGGNIATYCQIDEPVKPTTVSMPIALASRAVSFISSAARSRTPSGDPSPHTFSRTIAWCRSSIGSSQIACPVRWLLIAQQPRPCFFRISSRPSTYPGSSHRQASRCSPETAISSPS